MLPHRAAAAAAAPLLRRAAASHLRRYRRSAGVAVPTTAAAAAAAAAAALAASARARSRSWGPSRRARGEHPPSRMPPRDDDADGSAPPSEGGDDRRRREGGGGGGGGGGKGGFFDVSERWADDVRKGAAKFLDDFVLSGDERPSPSRPRSRPPSPPPPSREDGAGDAEEAGFLDRIREALDEGRRSLQSSRAAPPSKEEEEEGRAGAHDVGGGGGGYFSLSGAFASLLTGGVEGDGGERSVKALIDRARDGADAGEVTDARSFREIWAAVDRTLRDVGRTLETNFGHLDLRGLDPTAFFYYLEREDERKNPSWKRRAHRYQRGVDVRKVEDLNDALELAHLSYADSVDEIRDGLTTGTGTRDAWELAYCQTESHPGEPGHFLALKKGQSRWSASLDVLLVVRGTKSAPDMITDALMDPVDYRGGKAHQGSLRSGRFLVEKHGKFLRNLRGLSGKRRINLTIVGHSLGAAAASIAGMEFRDDPSIDVDVVGFGCPALLSRDLSEGARDCITTVVGDADVVPRSSAATLANLALDVMEYDWTDRALRDVRQALDELRIRSPVPVTEADVDQVMEYVDSVVGGIIRPGIRKRTEGRMEPVLYPPGTCVHFYRDGSGISGSYVPCTFFGEIDLCRTMVDDHTTKRGYGRIFLELMRQYHDDDHFAFERGRDDER